MGWRGGRGGAGDGNSGDGGRGGASEIGSRRIGGVVVEVDVTLPSILFSSRDYEY